MLLRFLIREILGWLLLLLGLYGLYGGFSLVYHRQVVQAGPLCFAAFLIFNLGIALLRTASAARLTMHIHARRTDKPDRLFAGIDPLVLRMVGVVIIVVCCLLTVASWQHAAVHRHVPPIYLIAPGLAVVGAGLALFPRDYGERPIWRVPGEWLLVMAISLLAVLGNCLILQSVIGMTGQ